MSSYIEKLKEKMGGGNKEEAKEKAKKLDERDPEKSVKKQKQQLKTGGRAGFKSGMRVCKLAKKGKGKAYGKNS